MWVSFHRHYFTGLTLFFSLANQHLFWYGSTCMHICLIHIYLFRMFLPAMTTFGFISGTRDQNTDVVFISWVRYPSLQYKRIIIISRKSFRRVIWDFSLITLLSARSSVRLTMSRALRSLNATPYCWSKEHRWNIMRKQRNVCTKHKWFRETLCKCCVYKRLMYNRPTVFVAVRKPASKAL